MLFSEKSLPKLIIITPIISIALLTIFITYYYVQKVSYFVEEDSKLLIQEYVKTEKVQSEAWVKQLILLFEYTHSNIEQNIKVQLKSKVDLAHKSATHIYDKYKKTKNASNIKERIKDALSQMVYNSSNYVWITDYQANNILAASEKMQGINLSNFQDADHRNIILEEIQKVRKHKEGYLKTRFREGESEQIMFVKDFGHFEWFFGMGLHVNYATNELKSRLINMVTSIPTQEDSFVAIFDNSGAIYTSASTQKSINSEVLSNIVKKFEGKALWVDMKNRDISFFVDKYEPFGWYVLHGFSKDYIASGITKRQKRFDIEIEEEIKYITYSSLFIGVIVALLSLLFSRRIIEIFKEYNNRVKSKEKDLHELNESLEIRVHEEVDAHQAKDKMMIQQAKMAAMGDMISMIAHQWRQPLNQMSYVFMNIEGAYEYDELTQEYLDDKLKEGTQLLEFMSHTIDDFRDFFRPDKEKENVQIDEVVHSAISLIQKSLDVHNIVLDTSFTCKREIYVYRNELVQVLLNLIKNAKDVLVEREIEDSIIVVELRESENEIIIDISDNGGGVDVEIQEKIFEPYFTTKNKSSGTGLGLYMSKIIIQEHLQATIELKNSEAGACFEIRFQKDNQEV